MPENKSRPVQSSLSGARIWLSGSLPEKQFSSASERNSILQFVRDFSRRVFEGGGHIVHGSHPSLLEVLLEESDRHQKNSGRKDCLVLAVSRYWSKDPNRVRINEWRKAAVVYETAEVAGERARDDSLDLLRKWMVSRCDAIVVVGGKWWQQVNDRAGIPLELGLGIERGLPCFLLGGLGGVAQNYVETHPWIFRQLKNGLSEAENRQLAIEASVHNLSQSVCSQLEKLPLVRGSGADGISFRILALDGGGLKGAFTAATLAAWEKHTGHRIVDHFDLIAGTSTGGILALGLGLGLSAQQMLDFYVQRGPVIFPITRFRSKLQQVVKHLFSPKYSQVTLLRELKSAFYGDAKATLLRDSVCRLVIPSYHVVGGVSHQFRTPHHPDLTADARTEFAHAALATAAAPTFFSAAKIADMVGESSYLDGGVWANSPAMAAIIEAVCFLRIPLERVDVLSVGTTEEPFTARKATRAGLVGWLWKKRILDLLMNVQQESSIRLARHLVSDPRFLRVNTITRPGTYTLDGANEIRELASLGQLAAIDSSTIAQVKSRFLNGVTVIPWERFG